MTVPTSPSNAVAQDAILRHFGMPFVFLFIALLLLSGCGRDTEAALRAKLDQWFLLGETAFFQTEARCTGAMIYLTAETPRPEFEVQSSMIKAKEAFKTEGIVAIQIATMSPAELTDALLLTGTGTFGKQALAAASLAVSCFKGTEVSNYLYEAFMRRGATLAYETQNAGLIVLDPHTKRLFYVAGDVW